MRAGRVASHLSVDELDQLLQQLVGGDQGVEHACYVVDVRVEGAGGGAQVAEEVGDHVGQGRFAVIAIAVIIKSRILEKESKTTGLKTVETLSIRLKELIVTRKHVNH